MGKHDGWRGVQSGVANPKRPRNTRAGWADAPSPRQPAPGFYGWLRGGHIMPDRVELKNFDKSYLNAVARIDDTTRRL